MNDPPATRSSLGRRTAAFLIDALIAIVATSMVLGIFLGPESSDPATVDPELAGLISILFISICFNYFVVAEWRWGQTIGKNMLGIRVLGADGSSLSWNASSIRNLLRLVDVLVIGPILIASDGRRLGDRAARTIVVAETVTAKNYGFAAAASVEAAGAPEGTPAAPSPPDSSGSETGSGRNPGVAATWNVPTVGLGIVTALGAILVGTIVVGAFDPTLESQAGAAAAQAVFALALIGTAVFFAGREVAPGAEDGAAARLGLARLDGRTVRMALLGWGAYLLLAAVIAPLLEPEQDGIARELDDVAGTVAIVVAGLLIVVAAPLSEEIFFRGFIFAGLRNSVPFWAAAIVSAAIWGSLHLTGGNIGVVVQLTVFGLVLAWLYERSGSLWAPLIAHTINNAIAYTLLVTNVI